VTPAAPAAAVRDPATRALLDWLRSLLAGDGALGSVNDGFAAAAVRCRLAALARSHGARHPELTRAERSDFVRGQQVLLGSARVVEMLDEAAIPCATLKGPALASRFWGDITMRRSGDIDVLVEPGNFAAAEAVLQTHGCRRVDLYPEWYVRRWLCNVAFVADDRALPKVELHWSFVRPYLGHPRIADVLGSLDRVDCGGRVLPALEPAWQLLAVCIHAIFHDIELRSLLDVAFVARALDEEDWSRAIAHARAAGLAPGLYYGVQASVRLLGWWAPGVLDELRPGPARARVAELYLASLSPFSGVTTGARQFGKFATPLVSTGPGGLAAALPFSLVDRPRVLSRLDGAVRRLARRVVRPL
jgi:hypothetical protein